MLEDLHWASQQLMEALHIRERYMRVSHQSFPTITSRFFHKKHKNHSSSPGIDASVAQSLDNSAQGATGDIIGSDDKTINKPQIRQPYPSARVIKHEDRQSIAGKFYKSKIVTEIIYFSLTIILCIFYNDIIFIYLFCAYVLVIVIYNNHVTMTQYGDILVHYRIAKNTYIVRWT